GRNSTYRPVQISATGSWTLLWRALTRRWSAPLVARGCGAQDSAGRVVAPTTNFDVGAAYQWTTRIPRNPAFSSQSMSFRLAVCRCGAEAPGGLLTRRWVYRCRFVPCVYVVPASVMQCVIDEPEPGPAHNSFDQGRSKVAGQPVA